VLDRQGVAVVVLAVLGMALAVVVPLACSTARAWPSSCWRRSAWPLENRLYPEVSTRAAIGAAP
jgi:hypothetical protein